MRQKFLVEGVDWRIGAGRRVEISAAGLKKLGAKTLEHPGLMTVAPKTALTLALSPEEREAGGACTYIASLVERVPVIVRVVMGRTPLNKKILICECEERSGDWAGTKSGRRVVVRVRDNSVFMAGMEIGAWPARVPGGTWEFAGRPGKFDGRAPRGRGRW